MGYPNRIDSEGETWYDLYAFTAAKGGEYPLEPDWIREKFRHTFMFYARGAFRKSGYAIFLVTPLLPKDLVVFFA
jgi:hypothetical protein